MAALEQRMSALLAQTEGLMRENAALKETAEGLEASARARKFVTALLRPGSEGGGGGGGGGGSAGSGHDRAQPLPPPETSAT